ncbi:Protein involved in sulfur oxidation DsrS [Gammaproteobacteria bacterium]
MDLSPEDALRLHVLLANNLQAVRIDEATLTVYGLTDQGEMRVVLNPTGRDDRYLRVVRELISGQVLGSPGGYPVFLQRWTRMGQTRDLHLEQLLLLGEPEAVVAVVHAAGLTDELARRAWWALPSADNARHMLERECVVQGGMGPILAEYLVENLPFEDDPATMTASVRLVLQFGLLEASRQARLWVQAQRNAAYLLGFLQALPDALPNPLVARSDGVVLVPVLEPLAAAGNSYAAMLLRVLSGPGQSWLRAVEEVLRRSPNQEVINAWLETVAAYFVSIRPALPEAELEILLAEGQALCTGTDLAEVAPAGLAELCAAVPVLIPELCALLCFSRLGYTAVRPIFSRTTAIGTLMHRKLEPLRVPLLEQIAILRRGREFHQTTIV